MPEEAAVLEPPVSTPETAEAAKTAVQHAFDLATQTKQTLKPKVVEKPVEKVEPPKVEPPKVEAKPEEKPQELKLPSFITGEEKKPVEPEIKLEDLPKEPPATASENEKINWKKTRTLLEKQEAEIKSLKEKQVIKQDTGKELSQADLDRLKSLETENKQLHEHFQRLGLEQHPQFVAQVIRPLQANYARARQIITDGGGDISQLDKALSLTGKPHYEAMDEILESLPQSAKQELMTTVGNWRQLAEARSRAIADAPRVLENLQKEQQATYEKNIKAQYGQMEELFDKTLKDLRDNHKLEVLLKSDDPETSWWNEIPSKVEAAARKIFLDSNDMSVAAQASILAPAAFTFRDLWLKSEARANKAEKELLEIRGAEPRLSDATSVPEPSKNDIKEPFEKAFLRTLKSQTGR